MHFGHLAILCATFATASPNPRCCAIVAPIIIMRAIANIYVYAMVRVMGVSLTKLREQRWQAAPAITFTAAPVISTVTAVGVAAEAKGMVKSCEISCVFVQHTLPSQGRYEIKPSTCIVAMYCPVPTIEIDLTENEGVNDGTDSTHDLWQSLCEMFT